MSRYEQVIATVRRAIQSDPLFAARFHPYQQGRDTVLVPPRGGDETDPTHAGLPVPPRDLHVGYGADTEHYLKSGEWDREIMARNLGETGFTLAAGDRVLEWGCAAARILRNFATHAETAEVWGVDVNAAPIRWCQAHLNPPFHFSTTTTFPHLPFEDNYFRLVFGASVLTHVFDLSDAWLMELRRIVAPGGRVYLTIHDEHTIKTVCQPEHWASGLRQELERLFGEYPEASEGFAEFVLHRMEGDTLVFHHTDYLRRQWGQFLTVLDIKPNSHDYQSAVILSKQ